LNNTGFPGDFGERPSIRRDSGDEEKSKVGWLNQKFFQLKYLRQIEVPDVSEILSIIQRDFSRTRCEIVISFPHRANHVISFEHQSEQEKCSTDKQ
jgi:hypothetical protein